ncbi:hypothetical protein EIP91_011998, partial [Steccherinum ochraceum]
MAMNKGKETRPKGPQTQNSEPVELSEEALAKKEKIKEQTKLRQRKFRARQKAEKLAAEAELKSAESSIPKRKHSNSGAKSTLLAASIFGVSIKPLGLAPLTTPGKKTDLLHFHLPLPHPNCTGPQKMFSHRALIEL